MKPGQTFRKDPAASDVLEMDWTDWLGSSALIASSTWTIDGPDAILTKDNPSIVSGSLKTRVRVIAGTLGSTYTLTNQIVTNETPTQTEERSILVKIVNR